MYWSGAVHTGDVSILSFNNSFSPDSLSADIRRCECLPAGNRGSRPDDKPWKNPELVATKIIVPHHGGAGELRGSRRVLR